MNLEQLNMRFDTSCGAKGQVRFLCGKGDMPVAEISNDLCTASIALQGAHLLNFQARGEKPLIWMSEDAVFQAGKSLRGGIPVCWPWFGSHPTDSALPSHGYARIAQWNPVAITPMPGGGTRISLELETSVQMRQVCSHSLRVQLHITAGTSLSLALETTNSGISTFTLSQALHSYFQVGDVRQASIEGLAGCEYMDKLDDYKRKQQHGAVNIHAETDRIYLETGKQCVIVDPVMGRRIIMHSQGSASTVVWNPWVETATKMGDLGKDGYLNMLCVETANAADDVVELAAGVSHCLSVNYASELL